MLHVLAVVDEIARAIFGEQDSLIAMERLFPHVVIALQCLLKSFIGRKVPLLHTFSALGLRELLIAYTEALVSQVRAQEAIMAILAVVAEGKIR